MNILYHFPNPDTVYAQRTISKGFENAFLSLGHKFRFLTSGDDFISVMNSFRPDIFIITSHPLYTRQYNQEDFFKFRKDNGIKMFTKIGFWDFPEGRINFHEEKPLKERTDVRKSIENGFLGDVFFNQIEKWDMRTADFTKETGKPFYTVPLAADSFTADIDAGNQDYKNELNYIGTNLPQKKAVFNEYLFPLKRKYQLKLYGQDWDLISKSKGSLARLGQHFNIPFIKSVYKTDLKLEDEYSIYRQSKISLNLHSDHQRKYGGDCNERTFKIPLAGGFELVDDVKVISMYFEPEKEIIISRNTDEWFENVDYFLKNPDKRTKIINAGKEKVLKYHTYTNRAQLIMDIAKNI